MQRARRLRRKLVSRTDQHLFAIAADAADQGTAGDAVRIERHGPPGAVGRGGDIVAPRRHDEAARRDDLHAVANANTDFFFQAEDGIRDLTVTGVQTCALPIFIIAGSILSARALAPVDLAIANWRGFIGARQGWKRLTDLLTLLPSQLAPMALRPPVKSLTVENVGVVPPGSEKVVIQDVSLSLQAGNGLGVIGPSGSGKSS